MKSDLSTNLEAEQTVRQTLTYTDLLRLCPAMWPLVETLEQTAASGAPLLVLGETGSGKEIVSRAACELGPRSEQAFLVVDCSCLPENLIESELFGHEKGAFTGADKRRIGRLENANGGTILLDEAGDLPLAQQKKLLRALDGYPITRVGSSEEIQLDVRFILATNRNLEEMVENGTFREDLYYRMNVVSVTVPPLRERPEDITALANSFLREFANGSGPVEFSAESMAVLLGYAWPGNVRQLRSAIHSAVVFRRGSQVIEPHHLPEKVRRGETPRHHNVIKPNVESAPKGTSPVDAVLATFPEVVKMRDVERELIRRALIRTNGNQAKAARELGIARETLRQRVEKQGIKYDPNITQTQAAG
ncbi:MAG: PAS modulated sigma54 specific transcriptional regulator, Fis family [Parcubacteria group bacterium GW2011_GWA2_47_16]|nr:MAG: PAS modulated sigma54 specific transcriptional regulator, Fis family [Parcubacteria group bacterium GW2011_GWA2_47_16]